MSDVQIIRVARWTLAVAVVAAIAGIIAAWPVVQGWFRAAVDGTVAAWPVVQEWLFR